MSAIGTREVDEINKAMPPNLDILLVEQEVQASNEITALQASERVHRADQAPASAVLCDSYECKCGVDGRLRRHSANRAARGTHGT